VLTAQGVLAAEEADVLTAQGVLAAEEADVLTAQGVLAAAEADLTDAQTALDNLLAEARAEALTETTNIDGNGGFDKVDIIYGFEVGEDTLDFTNFDFNILQAGVDEGGLAGEVGFGVPNGLSVFAGNDAIFAGEDVFDALQVYGGVGGNRLLGEDDTVILIDVDGEEGATLADTFEGYIVLVGVSADALLANGTFIGVNPVVGGPEPV